MKKILSLLLMYTFLLSSLFSSPAYAARSDQEKDLKDFLNTGQRTELTSLNKEDCRFFKNEDGTITAELKLKKNSPAETGKHLASDAKSNYHNQSQRFKVKFPHKIEKELLTLNLKNSQISFTLKNQQKVTGEAENNRIKYSDIMPSTDITYEVLENGVKETITIKDDNAPAEFIFPLTTSQLSYKERASGQVDFYSTTDQKKLFHLEAVYALNAAGEEIKAVKQSIVTEKNHTSIKIHINKDKLTKKDYPVKIDPTITIVPNEIEGMDTYIESPMDIYDYPPYQPNNRGILGLASQTL